MATGPKIFPISNYASKEAFSRFLVRSNAQKGENPITQEMEIIKKHYEPTGAFIAGTSQILSTADTRLIRNILFMAMNLVHYAARIEAQTKQTRLPFISREQMIEYLAREPLIEMSAEDGGAYRVATEPYVEKFKTHEIGLIHEIDRLSYSSLNRSILTGAAIMSDFLKEAPQIKR